MSNQTFDNKNYFNKYLDSQIKDDEIAETYLKQYFSTHGEYPTLKGISRQMKDMDKWLYKDQELYKILSITRKRLNVVGVDIYLESM